MKYLWLAVFLLVGCAQIEGLQKERAKYFAPESLPDHKTIFTKAYTEALTKAHADPSPSTITAFVDAGNALNAQYCTNWFQRLTLARRGLVANDHTLGIIGGLLTALAGAFSWPADVVTLLGAGQVAMHGLSDTAQADVLGAPSQYQAQETVYSLQTACGSKLLADAPTLKFSAAYARLEGCARICSHDAASEAATKGLQAIRP